MRPTVAAAIAVLAAVSTHFQTTYSPPVTPETTGCTPEQRRAALEKMQREVLEAVPAEIESMEEALAPGGALDGWRASHGFVVLDTAGAIALDNVKSVLPLPQLLLYEPSSGSRPSDWLGFDGPDDPYRLAGWGYFAPYKPGSSPPRLECVSPSEWLVHEAGWHLKDGGMHLVPGASEEPEPPPGVAIHMWHPQVWDIHVWRGKDGVPSITFANPHRRRGGRKLPDGAFYYLVDGQRRPPVVDSR